MSKKPLHWRGLAPANIALIKYMGKVDGGSNQPANASLSFTLDHLLSTVEISEAESGQDHWAPLKGDGFEEVRLSEAGQARFLKHFEALKTEFQISGAYVVRSANNFLADCGIASSASSFAALTKATHQLALERGQRREAAEALTTTELSALSRLGSGSSCRSFFTPWALWRSSGAEPVSVPFAYLHHQVVILSHQKKSVSSSDAHKRVVTSELYQGRATRAEHRLKQLLDALNIRDWRASFELVWSDFWDMHALFETSQPAFGYMNAASMKVLEFSREIWRDTGDGPLVTMDAGANVHLLYRPDQTKLARRMGDELASLGSVISSPSIHEENLK